MSTLLGGFYLALFAGFGVFQECQKFFDVSDFFRLNKKCCTIGFVVIIIKENNINLIIYLGKSFNLIVHQSDF